MFTLTQLDEKLAGRLGEYEEMACTTNGAADGSTLISTDLLRYPSETFTRFTVEITSGAQITELRVIQSFTVVAGVATITPYNAFGGQILNAVTFRVHRYRPEDKLAAINEALPELTAIPNIISEDLVAGELLRNRRMLWWESPGEPAGTPAVSAVPYDWERVAGIVAQETTIVYDGPNSLKLTGTGTAGTVRQRIELERELRGVTVTLEGYVYGTADAATGLRLTQGDSVATAALTASTAWTKLTTTLTLSNDAEPRALYVTLLNTTANIAYFGGLSLKVPSTDLVFWLPYSTIFNTLHDVQVGPDSTLSKTQVANYSSYRMPSHYDRSYAFYPPPGRSLPNGRHVRMIGLGKRPTLTLADDEVDLDDDGASLLVVRATIRLMHKVKGTQFLSDAKHWQGIEADAGKDLVTLEDKVRRARPSMRYPAWR